MKVFLFDIDGTLIHSQGAGRAALDLALRAAFQIETTNAIDLGGRTDRGIAAELFTLHDIEANDANWIAFQDAYITALRDTMQTRQGSILPGVLEILDILSQEANAHLGLLTGNVRMGAQIKLSHFELWERFAFGGFGDRHENRDEVAREAHEAACDSVGRDVPTDRVFVIGDTVRDVTCARAIGARAIAVCTGSGSPEQLRDAKPDVLLEDLTDGGDWWAK